jgi:hypothetical protein
VIDRGVRAAALGCTLVGAVSLLRFADPRLAIDDSWVSFRYARNLVLSGELSYEVGAPPVEGMTNLLWTLLAAVWIGVAPDLDPILGARVVGGLLHLAAIVGVVLLAARIADRAGGRGALAGAVAGGILAATGNLAYFAMSGLETPLWIALFVLALERADAAWHGNGRAAVGLGIALGLLATTRPEGVLLGLLACAALTSRRRLAIRAAVPFVLACAALEGFRLTYYGELLPNTFHAKPGVLSEGVEYVASGLVYATGFVGLAAAGPALRKLPWTRAVAVILVIMAAGTAWSGGDWMPGLRRLALPTVGAAVLCGVGAALSDRPRITGAFAAAWFAAAATALGTGWDHTTQVPWEAEALARAANATEGVDVVAMADIGRFGYFFEGAILDLVGLTDRHIARLEGKHGAKIWDEAYFRLRNPALVLARSEDPVVDPLPADPRFGTTEHDVVRSILNHGGYRYHSTLDLGLPRGRYWVIFRRNDITLPEEIWGKEARRDLRELLMEEAAIRGD